MITIKEIAEEAGVSTTTVSNVLHGKVNKVSPQMVEKINALLKEHNYIPRFGLSALTSSVSKMIGVLISTPEFVEDNLYEKPFYGSVIGTLERVFRQQGYYIIVFSSKNIDEIMRMTLGWNVDGVISVSMPKEYIQMIADMTKKPVVSIDMDVSDDGETTGCYNVTSPDFEAGKRMAKYLFENEIKEIIYMTNVKRGSDIRRYRGANAEYQEQFGVDKQLSIITLSRTLTGRMKQYEELEKYLGKHAALFFSTDLNAVEAIGYYQRKGISIPEELSIVGVDDDIYGRLFYPTLTTISSSGTKKAEVAAQMLLDIVEERSVFNTNEVIEMEFIERESVYIKQNNSDNKNI